MKNLILTACLSLLISVTAIPANAASAMGDTSISSTNPLQQDAQARRHHAHRATRHRRHRAGRGA